MILKIITKIKLQIYLTFLVIIFNILTWEIHLEIKILSILSDMMF